MCELSPTSPSCRTLSAADQEYLDYVLALAEEREIYGRAVDALTTIAQMIRDAGRVTGGCRTVVRSIVEGRSHGTP